MKNYDAYLFDWDGTIASSFSLWLPLVKEVLKDYRVVVDDTIIVRRVFGRLRQGLLELGVPPSEVEVTITTLLDKAQTRVPDAPLYPGIRELLKELQKQGKRLGLVTASARAVIDQALQTHDLQNLFDVVVTGSEVTEQKPNPEGLLQALDRLGVSASQAVMLGDSEKDILAAHNAGMHTILFFPSEHASWHNLVELKTTKPTYIIHDWNYLHSQIMMGS